MDQLTGNWNLNNIESSDPLTWYTSVLGRVLQRNRTNYITNFKSDFLKKIKELTHMIVEAC